jgi:hypothetical protein
VYKDPEGEAALASTGGGAAPSWKLAFLLDNVSKVTLGILCSCTAGLFNIIELA